MKTKKINAFCLKMIAVSTMIIDHFFAIVFPVLFAMFAGEEAGVYSNNMLYKIGRSIGRVAFPIFCYSIAEGAIYSKNRKQYALRLFIFAIIAIPFHNFVFDRKFYDISELNILFALLGGLLAIMLIDYVDQIKTLNKYVMVAIKILIFLFFCIILTLIKAEYHATSVFLICGFYYSKKKNFYIKGRLVDYKIVQSVTAMIGLSLGIFEYYFMSLIYLYKDTYSLSTYAKISFENIGKELSGLAALIPIFLYNGQEGKKMPKYFFYFFYPIHMAILKLIALMIK